MPLLKFHIPSPAALVPARSCHSPQIVLSAFLRGVSKPIYPPYSKHGPRSPLTTQRAGSSSLKGSTCYEVNPHYARLEWCARQRAETETVLPPHPNVGHQVCSQAGEGSRQTWRCSWISGTKEEKQQSHGAAEAVLPRARTATGPPSALPILQPSTGSRRAAHHCCWLCCSSSATVPGLGQAELLQQPQQENVLKTTAVVVQTTVHTA